jgi:uncharacterized protein
MPFPCERCGACCRSLKCRHLKGNNYCTIYDHRPEICKVDEMISKLGLDSMRDEIYGLTKQACKMLRNAEV